MENASKLIEYETSPFLIQLEVEVRFGRIARPVARFEPGIKDDIITLPPRLQYHDVTLTMTYM